MEQLKRELTRDDLLDIEPPLVSVPFELGKQLRCTIQLSNTTDEHVAFSVLTDPKTKFYVQPCMEVLGPRCKCAVVVTMREQTKELDEDDFWDSVDVYMVTVPAGVTDITDQVFSRSNKLGMSKLNVFYLQPPKESEWASATGIRKRTAVYTPINNEI